MDNTPYSPADSSFSGGSEGTDLKSYSAPTLEKAKSFPPPDADKKPFLVDDFTIPVDVDLTRMEFASVDDPAFFCVYASDAEIHAALGVPLPAGHAPPVAQRATPALSAAAFRAFVVSEFTAVCNINICRVPRSPPGVGYSDSAFQKLSVGESEDLSNRCIPTHFTWNQTVAATAGAGTGHVYIMYPSPGGGGRSPQAKEARRLTYFVSP